MTKKRKLESESNETSEPMQKQQECDKENPGIRNDDHQRDEDQVVNHDALKEGPKDDDNIEAGSLSGSRNSRNEDDDEEEPLDDLLEPFSKDQLLILLKEAAERHRDVADRIRIVAEEDPVHRKIFVHGLGWDTKADALIEAFKHYGEIEDCKCVVDKVSGQSKGYGFILFRSRSGARKALKQPQKKIGTRMTACQLAAVGPVQGNPVVAAPAQHFSPENVQRKIYVSNVSADLDPRKLLEFFSRFGEIEEGPLGLDKATGRPKGFTLFVYRSAEGAKRALEEPHKTFEGHVLHCHKANDGPKQGKQHQHQHHHHSHKQNTRYQRNENTGYGAPGGHGHFIAGNNQSAQAINPAIGQALTALLASQGAGLGLNQAFGQALLGALGTASPVAAAGMPSGYGTQNITPRVYPAYGAQAGFQGGYQTQQPGQGSAGRGQHGVRYGGPYMGH
ncbi:PREDICTED: UBP1-associated protein 2B-like [Camelina sativa]|uniref:UBP1-associated protein 2B-like n=1 Tax=Camelina sativa TaxID=90675 RepID=A0ABM0ZLX3_CAMSA|nr:PREDICTED: UBP1-associated protein 2B-like [Camelina sativa]XP_010517588.1 PREDICTED: UBP1-associated protein 2B-like [Camelina sativa]XP_010517590.1 PREDICTED: UBP1-associated protein 2B-like [Camelina sativa]